MNIGITGATGFLGSYFINHLLNKQDYAIKAFTREPVKSDKNITWVLGDLSSHFDCENFIADLDIIVHFAHTNNSQLTSNNDIISDANLNLIPNLTLLNAIKKSETKPHFIYISSGGAVYGSSCDKTPLRETDCCTPFSSYGIQKLAMENYLRLWAVKSYLTVNIMRVSNPYGVLLPSVRRQGLIGVALNRLLSDEPVQIFGNPENIRDYIHLEDMCRAIEMGFHSRKSYEIYNIGSGTGYSVEEVLNLIEKYSGKSLKKEYIQEENAQAFPDWNILDITKAKNGLGWTPETSLESGLKNFCHEVFDQKISL